MKAGTIQPKLQKERVVSSNFCRHTAELVKSLIATNKNLEESKKVPLISDMLFSRENTMIFATMGYMLNTSITVFNDNEINGFLVTSFLSIGNSRNYGEV